MLDKNCHGEQSILDIDRLIKVPRPRASCLARSKEQEAKIAKLRDAMDDPTLRRAKPLTREPSMVDGVLAFKG